MNLNDIPTFSDDTLKQVNATLQSLLASRQNTKHNARTKKLNINFNQSDNGHLNSLMNAVKAEMAKRNLNNG